MAPGANYMGGKRNAARARSKDTTGRVHKNYFGRQRLDILSKGLRRRAPSGGNASGHGPRISASDIALSHAKHNAPGVKDQPTPSHSESPGNASSPSPSRSRPSKSLTQNRYRLRSSSGSRSSKILEALDTTEPLSMRAAMNKILSIPDLAGLSTRPSVRADTPPRTTSGSKRPRPADMERSDHPGKEQKRQKSQSHHSCSPSSVFQQSFEELDGFHSMDVDDTAADESDDHYFEPEDAFYEPAADDNTLHSSPSSAEFFQSETPPRLADSVFIQGAPPSSSARRRAKLLPPPQNIPFVTLSSHSAGLGRSPSVASSKELDGYNVLNAESKIVLHDNLYDYQDPWSAIGVILGLEEPRDEIDDLIQEVEDVAAEILQSPDVDPTLMQPKHSHAALSSNSALRSLSPKNPDSTFLSYTDEVDHFEFDPPAVAAASPQSDSDSDKFNNDDYLSCNSYLHSHVGHLHELDTFQRDVIPETDVGAKISVSNPTTATDFEPSSFSPLLRPRLLANSNHGHHFEESNPTTPTNRKPKSSPHTRDDEGDMNLPIPSLLVSRPASSPSPLPTVDFPERFPKFTKFPSPLNLKRTAVQPSPYIRPVPAIPSPHTSYMSSTPPLSQHKPVTSRSPFCFERIPRQDQVESRRAAKPADTTERFFNIDRAEYPEARRITQDIQDRPAKRSEKAVVHFEEREHTEMDGPKPERFFGDLCLFADDIDAPESDD
ncbi:hypothetical protein DFH06DRAFT_118074 [Mycena polygramma]|nr:hypothetical protein DFH06DRAFT_118074 [Mycena polygramma]